MIKAMVITDEVVACSACGKKAPMSAMFMSMNLNASIDMDDRRREALEKSAGRYFDSTYHICYECFLDKMGAFALRRVHS